jgi:hypothetical protein
VGRADHGPADQPASRGPAALPWLDDLGGHEALMVTSSGVLRTTAGWTTW